jgi:hypothetical protein
MKRVWVMVGAAWASGAAFPQIALAQSPAPVPAAARAEADRLIAAAHAEPYFVNITEGAQPLVRHVASGMVCAFEPGQAANAIHIYQSASTPGEDVGCATRRPLKGGGFADDVLFATRTAQTPVLKDGLEAMAASIRARAPDARPAQGKFGSAPALGALLGQALGQGKDPPHAAERLQITVAGQSLFTRAAAGVVRDWFISQRVTSPVADAPAADALGESEIAAAVNQVRRAKLDPARLIAGAAEAQGSAEAEAHRLLQALPMPDEFADATAGGVPRVQHKLTGAVCDFTADYAHNRLVQNDAGFVCGAIRDYGAENLEFAFMPGGTAPQVETMIGAYVSAQFPGASPFAGADGLKAFDEDKGPLAHTVRRYDLTASNGAKLFVRVSYALAGDWLVVQRILGPELNAQVTDTEAEKGLLRTLDEMAQKRAQTASAAPAAAKP